MKCYLYKGKIYHLAEIHKMISKRSEISLLNAIKCYSGYYNTYYFGSRIQIVEVQLKTQYIDNK